MYDSVASLIINANTAYKIVDEFLFRISPQRISGGEEKKFEIPAAPGKERIAAVRGSR